MGNRNSSLSLEKLQFSFHTELVKRKYQHLYSPRGGRKPGPIEPSKAVIDCIVKMKQRKLGMAARVLLNR